MLKVATFALVATVILQVVYAEKTQSTVTETNNDGKGVLVLQSRLLLKLREELSKEQAKNSTRYVDDLKRAVRSMQHHKKHMLRSCSKPSSSCDCESCKDSSSSSSCSSNSSFECDKCKVVNMKKLHQNLKRIANIIKGASPICTSSVEKCSCEVCKPKIRAPPKMKQHTVLVPVYELETRHQYQAPINLNNGQGSYYNYANPKPIYNNADVRASQLYHRQGFHLENKPLGYINPSQAR